jgi:hypothetical protein
MSPAVVATGVYFRLTEFVSRPDLTQPWCIAPQVSRTTRHRRQRRRQARGRSTMTWSRDQVSLADCRPRRWTDPVVTPECEALAYFDRLSSTPVHSSSRGWIPKGIPRPHGSARFLPAFPLLVAGALRLQGVTELLRAGRGRGTGRPPECAAVGRGHCRGHARRFGIREAGGRATSRWRGI